MTFPGGVNDHQRVGRVQQQPGKGHTSEPADQGQYRDDTQVKANETELEKYRIRLESGKEFEE